MDLVREKQRAAKSLMRPLVKTAAILGIIQGGVWSVLSITAIILYHTADIDYNQLNIVGAFIYSLFLVSDGKAEDGFILGAKEFSYFMYIYFILSITWMIVSAVTLWGTLGKKREKYYDSSIRAWIVVTSLVALLDLILLILLSCDYHKIQERLRVDETLSLSEEGVVIYGIVMTMAARGFVLWVVNVIFIGILSKYAYQKYNEESNKINRRGNRSVIDGYSGARQDLPWQNGGAAPFGEPTSFDNKGFRDDQNDYPFASRARKPDNDRSPKMFNDYTNPSSRENLYANDRDYASPLTPRIPQRGDNQNSWNNRPAAKDNGGLARAYRSEPSSLPRTAKIGRQGGQRSPPLPVNSPYIPDPDYSPPGSPKVRGVLRPNSNYAMY